MWTWKHNNSFFSQIFFSSNFFQMLATKRSPEVVLPTRKNFFCFLLKCKSKKCFHQIYKLGSKWKIAFSGFILHTQLVFKDRSKGIFFKEENKFICFGKVFYTKLLRSQIMWSNAFLKNCHYVNKTLSELLISAINWIW